MKVCWPAWLSLLLFFSASNPNNNGVKELEWILKMKFRELNLLNPNVVKPFDSKNSSSQIGGSSNVLLAELSKIKV